MYPPSLPPAAPPPMPPQAGLPPQAPPAPPPVPQVPKIDDTPIPMTADDLAKWWKEVDLAMAARKQRETRWDELLRAYLPAQDPEAINSNTHFRNTEQKKATLFYQSPDLILTPLEPLQDVTVGPDGQPHSAEDVTVIKQAVLNKLLGRDGVDLKRLADELLFEILQVSGIGPSKIAYEADFVSVPQTDPLTGLTSAVQVPVYETWTWKKFSSKKLLIPHDWKSTRYDDAPWLGFQGVKPLAVAIREKLVPPDFTPNATRDEHVFTTGSPSVEGHGASDLVEFVEIWYRPAFFDTGISHRQVQRRLVLIKGMDQPAKHTLSPYQTLDPQSGKLTAQSMEGFPIHLFTLRDLSDSAYVPSDAAMTDPLVRQENVWAGQDIKARDANIPRFLFDERVKDQLAKLAAGDFGDGAGVDQATLAGGIDKLIAPLPKLEKAASDVQGRMMFRQLIDQTLALGPNNAGSLASTVRSATEISEASATANTRQKAEQNRFLSDLLTGIRKFDALVQRFATEPDYVTWVGQDGTKRLAQWDQTLICGRYAYDAKPDSQLNIDEAQKRQQDIQVANILGNAPEANRTELLRHIARDFGLDPAKVIQPPPPKQPDPMRPGITFTGMDINPAAPQFAIVLEILRQGGYQVSDQAVQQAQGAAALLQQREQAMALLTAKPVAAGPIGGATPHGMPPPNLEHGGALEGSGGFHPVSKHAGEITGAGAGRKPM